MTLRCILFGHKPRERRVEGFLHTRCERCRVLLRNQVADGYESNKTTDDKT